MCFRGALSKHTLLGVSQDIMGMTQTDEHNMKDNISRRHILNKLNFIKKYFFLFMALL